MSFAVQMVAYLAISLLACAFLVRQYRAASPPQRRQISFAGASAAGLAIVGILILIFR